MPADKEALRQALLEIVRADLEAIIRTQNDAQQGATHAENRAEHAKDTRATEQSYLARGLAARVEALRDTEARLIALALNAFDEDEAIASGAVVSVLADDGPNDVGALQHWWLLPVAGGLAVESAGVTIRTITPGSPLGRALIGLFVGESGTLETPRGERSFEVVSIY